MPPFPLTAGSSSEHPFASTSSINSGSSGGNSGGGGGGIASIFKSLTRGAKSHSPPAVTGAQSKERRDLDKEAAREFAAKNRASTGASSRAAGVRPRRSTSGAFSSFGDASLPYPPSKVKRVETDDSVVSGSTSSNQTTNSGKFGTAGPSRGGFVVQTHAVPSKAAATVATTQSHPTTPSSTRQAIATTPSTPAGTAPQPISLETVLLSSKDEEELVGEEEMDLVPPPSTILPRLAAIAHSSSKPESLIPLIKLLAKSVGSYPFPPPSIAAASLSEALSSHRSTSTATSPIQPASSEPEEPLENTRPVTLINPTPLQIYLSQSHLLAQTSSPQLRSAVLELMQSCLEASLGSTGGIKEIDKAMYWDEIRRWAVEAKQQVDDGMGGKRWVLPDTDREALVLNLGQMTRGGRDLSDIPGLVSLLATFVTDSLPIPRPPSPLFDPSLTTPFLRSVPAVSAPHTSALALLTNLHKFSAPHITSASTLLALRAALEVARLREERDIGGQSDTGVLAFLSAVVRFGEVKGGKAARQRQSDLWSRWKGKRTDVEGNEGDEILHEVVSVVARIIGCEGLVRVVESHSSAASASKGQPMTFPSILPPLASELMRDLLRSPANQALKSLKVTLVGPPVTETRPLTPTLLLVGTLRALRRAFMEHSTETEASTSRGESSALSTGESRWPSLLSLGLPYLWTGIGRVMLWRSEFVDAQVLMLVEERLEASERVGQRYKEANSVVSNGVADTSRSKEEHEWEGVTYEEWDMAVEVLTKTSWHLAAKEEGTKSRWVLSEDTPPEQNSHSEEDDEGFSTTQTPAVLVAYSLLTKRVLRAWQRPGFLGPSERIFTLLVSIAPFLSEPFAHIVLDQCDLRQMCRPAYPDWLDRTNDVMKAFYVIPELENRTRQAPHPLSASTRRRALALLRSLYLSMHALPQKRTLLVGTVILPLLETTFEAENDSTVTDLIVGLIADISRDALEEETMAEDEEVGRLGTFERIRLLLSRVCKRSPRFVSGSTPNTPKPKRGPALSSLSRYSKDTTPVSPAMSTTSMGNSTAAPMAGESLDVSAAAASSLISVFGVCLAKSDGEASRKAIVIFRELLGLLAPQASDIDTTMSLRARLTILMWLVRLRADAAHRIYWMRDVDISESAKTISKTTAPVELGNEPSSSANAEEIIRSEARGRARQIGHSSSNERSISGSRNRFGRALEDRSPSRSVSGRPPGANGSASLWSVPEVLPSHLGPSIYQIGGKGLASFDHNRMREWTEEEDPGTGQLKFKEVEDGTPPEQWMAVLPVSEYLATVIHLFQTEHEWEFVSYLLCHLPEQLSNKHFACGPRAAQQIHVLRKLLCDGLRGGDRIFLGEVTLPLGTKRAEVHAVAYGCLSSLISYRSLFTKAQQDDMVDTFMYGLGNPRDTAKPCIHALAMASFELRPSMTKHLSEIVRHLQKIISSAPLAVHILELIAGIGQEPILYANFTEVDFQTVFGIALKYIQAHNEKFADNPTSLDNGEGIEYAFSQYVLLLAYYVIAAWYMALRLSERPKYVPFITRRLIQANEGKSEIDEPTEVCFDMIARYAYSNADPRPRRSAFDTVMSASHSTAAQSKTWIIGHSTLTIKSMVSPAWVECTVRRASGMMRMLCELQNISGVQNSADGDFIAKYLRHREVSHLSHREDSWLTDSLGSDSARPAINLLARAQSYSGVPRQESRAETVEETTISHIISDTSNVATQPTLLSGLLSADPSFFALQLSSFPEFANGSQPLLVPNDSQSQRGVTSLDMIPVVDFHKVGVLYAAPGQTTEKEILANIHGSKAYTDFISQLGRLVRLKGSRELDIYAGGLDQENDFDGKWTYVWDDDISQLVFHIATLMPTSLETDPQVAYKKRHIGNDFVKVIFNESGSDFEFDTLPGDFNFVNIVIEPHTPVGNPWIGPGMTNNAEFFKVAMQCRPGMPEVGPLGKFKMVTGTSLPHFIRQLCLHSNIFAQVYLASVGFEARQRTQKLEYSSNWRKRLQQIKILRKRVLQASGQGDTDVKPAQLDLDAAEASRLFTSWL